MPVKKSDRLGALPLGAAGRFGRALGAVPGSRPGRDFTPTNHVAARATVGRAQGQFRSMPGEGKIRQASAAEWVARAIDGSGERCKDVWKLQHPPNGRAFIQRSLQRGPRKKRAADPARMLPQLKQRSQRLQAWRQRLRRVFQGAAESARPGPYLDAAASLNNGRHERRRGLGDDAAAHRGTDFHNAVIREPQGDFQLIAAQGIGGTGVVRRPFQPSGVPGIAGVIEDQFPIQIRVHEANALRAMDSPSINRSTSSASE